MSKKIMKLFISYSHNDEPYFEVFTKVFKSAVISSQQFEWKIWDDTQIYVGTFWDDEIQNNIHECDVALLLLSLSFMASKYIKEKEYEVFIQKYKERGILIIPVIFAPCDFNLWQDLSKIQLFKPSGKSFGKPEINNFTFADLIEFNRLNGTALPNPNINRYILDLVGNIEKSVKHFLLNKEQKSIKLFEAENTVENKLSDYPKPSALFTGRKAELIEFINLYKRFRIFSIEGLGGTGKTQFIAKCIEHFNLDKKKIVWLDGSSQSNFNVFVEGAGYGSVLKGENKTNLELYSGLKDLIERDERIIFWDNYNDYEDPSFTDFLSFAHTYLQKATIILVTKVDPCIFGITSLPTVKLEGLNEDAITFAKKICSTSIRYNSISESELDTICKGVEGHPLAIEFSIWLMGYGKKADEILFHMPEFSGIKKVEEFSKRLFFDIFNHLSTTDDERECLLRCSAFREKMTYQEIQFLYNDEDIFHVLAGLIDKLLLTSKEEFYEIHPLVRSFSYEKLTDKKGIHTKAAEYYIGKRSETLDVLLEEKIFYHLSEGNEWITIADSIQIMGREFIQRGQLGLLMDFMNKLQNMNISRPIFNILYGDIAQIKSQWDTAIAYFKQASSNNEDKSVQAEGIIKHGEILYRRGYNKDALVYFENALEFCDKENLFSEKARALNDIGLVYIEYNELNIAYDKLNEALAIRNRIADLKGIAHTNNNLAIIFNKRNQFPKALRYYTKSLESAKKMGDKFEEALFYRNIGITQIAQGKLNEGHRNLDLSINISKELGDKSGVSQSMNSIGDIFMNKGELDKAFNMYDESLAINEEIGDQRMIGISYNNYGIYYCKKKFFEKALYYFFRSLALSYQVQNKSEENNIINSIKTIRSEVGSERFKDLAIKAYDKLNANEQSSVPLINFFDEPIIRIIPKIGRNQIITVRYKDGKTITVKYKKVESDIIDGKCIIEN